MAPIWKIGGRTRRKNTFFGQMCTSIYQFEASSRSHLHVGGQLRKIPDPDKIFTQLECGGVSQVESHGRFPPNIKDKNMGSIEGDVLTQKTNHRCWSKIFGSAEMERVTGMKS